MIQHKNFSKKTKTICFSTICSNYLYRPLLYLKRVCVDHEHMQRTANGYDDDDNRKHGKSNKNNNNHLENECIFSSESVIYQHCCFLVEEHRHKKRIKQY